MLKSLWIGASGMNAQQEKIDVIAHNLANIQTTGYKKQHVSFSELLHQAIHTENQPVLSQGDKQISTGSGVRVADISNVFTQGPINSTGRELDLAIDGQGFFEVILPDGSFAYTRDGIWRVAEDGSLVNSSGYPMSAPIFIPPDYREISITSQGEVSVVQADGSVLQAGTIPLYQVANPAKLQPIGGNLFVLPEGEQLPLESVPGAGSTGQLRQGFLENSNVDVLAEFTQLIAAQRIYQFSSRTIQTADEMWSMANNLRR